LFFFGFGPKVSTSCHIGRKIIQRRRVNGLVPERLNLRNIVLIGSGNFHSFAVDKSGKVFGWGLNSFRQIGIEDSDGGWEDIILSPTEIKSLNPSLHNGSKVIQISGGDHHTLFLFDNGEVWGCGRCDSNEIGLAEDDEEMIASNERKKKAQEARKELEAKLKTEELGKSQDPDASRLMSSEEAALAAQEAAANKIPLPNDYIPLPTRIIPPRPSQIQLTPETSTNTNTRIVFISAGTRHNLAVSSEGELFGWGYAGQCQLGLGDEDLVKTPTKVRSKVLKDWFVVASCTGE
jgi:regulator of chromosome condensation